MAVADQNEARRRKLERRQRRLARQDVLPDRIARAGVKEIDALLGGLRLEWTEIGLGILS
jgi:hypothetical protein